MLRRMFSYRMAMSRIRVTVNLPFVTGVSWKSTMAVPMSPCVKCLLQTNNGRSYSWTGRFYCRRFISNKRSSLNSSQTGFAQRNRTTVIYVISLAVAVVGFSYAAVPLYRLYCQVRKTRFLSTLSSSSLFLPPSLPPRGGTQVY